MLVSAQSVCGDEIKLELLMYGEVSVDEFVVESGKFTIGLWNICFLLFIQCIIPITNEL